MKIEMNKAASFMLVMILCAIAVPALLTETASAAPGDRPIHGFVQFANTTLVGVGATVRGYNGTVLYDTATTDAASFYTVQNGVAPVDGDAITITATITVGTTVYTGSITFTMSVGETFPYQNITVEEVTIADFNLTVFVHDGNGTGIADQNVTLQNALGTYFNGTTNSTGYVVFVLVPGAYSYSVLADGVVGRFDHVGSISVVDRDVVLSIEMTLQAATGDVSIFGNSVSKYCLLAIVVLAAVGLAYLFVRNISKNGHESK